MVESAGYQVIKLMAKNYKCCKTALLIPNYNKKEYTVFVFACCEWVLTVVIGMNTGGFHCRLL